jgi:RNA-directed DNA polymerase
MERRGWVTQFYLMVKEQWEESLDKTKPYDISKYVVWEAYLRVKANKGAAGPDGESIADFEKELKNNLYKIWNRMSSGRYFPPPVRSVSIPKDNGGSRKLGIPTVSDRVAQMVVKLYLEPEVEPHFHLDSYGYRPGKSALDAVATARQRCWRMDWALDLDIKGFFDNLDHALIMRAVKKHTNIAWIILYLERWLKAPVQEEDGTLVKRDRGVAQGSVISPLLANTFMHHAFDKWMQENHPYAPFERYADDVLVHCKSEQQTNYVMKAIAKRLGQCKLELHPEKTKIVYCKDGKRKGSDKHERFDYLGFTFRPR